MNVRSRGRDATIDIAKGLAILAIVLGHVLRGLASSNIVDGDSPLYMVTDRALYMGHLAVFAFLAGLFVRQGVEKRGTVGYLRARVILFVYLYLLWQLLQSSVKVLTSSLVNSPVGLGDLLNLWKPEGQMWFLPFLILMTVGAALAKPWRSSWGSTIVIICAAVSIWSWGYDGGTVGTQGISLAVFFFSGAAMGARRLLLTINAMSLPVLLLVAVLSAGIFAFTLVATGAIPPTVNDGERTVEGAAWGLLSATSAVVSVVALSRILSQARVCRPLSFLGQRSMEIFLAHIIAASGTRIALSLLGVESVTVHVIAGTIVGIVLPLLLWRATIMVGFPWLFASPGLLMGKDVVLSATIRRPAELTGRHRAY
ncbi:fucose 4-O-acetylase-like acetyltransferase [Arthrobacter sp. UYEF6]